MLTQRLPAGTTEAEWVKRGRDASLRIAEIVARMRHITRLETVESQGPLPEILDIEKSSEDRA